MNKLELVMIILVFTFTIIPVFAQDPIMFENKSALIVNDNKQFHPCAEIFVLSFDCEWSNIQTMIIELAIAFIFGGWLASYFYKKQKEHTENLEKIKQSVTERVYERNIKYYTADFRIDELGDSNNKNAQEKATAEAFEIIDKIVEDKIDEITVSEIQGRGSSGEFVIKEGHVKIVEPRITTQNMGQMYQSANIHMEFSTLEVMDSVVSKIKTPYWDLQWHIKGEYDVHQTISKLDAIGKKPYSKSGSGGGDNTLWGKADYNIGTIGAISFTVSLWNDKINLTCVSRGPNEGMYQAHKVFSPGKLISILFGEMPHAEVQSLLQKCILGITK